MGADRSVLLFRVCSLVGVPFIHKSLYQVIVVCRHVIIMPASTLQRVDDVRDPFFSISKEHLGVFLEKQWILYTGVARGH